MTLNELKNAITSIYPTAKAGVDYSLATDSSGASTIALWNNALGAQPTDSQLATAAAAYDLGVAKGSQLAILGAAFNAAYGANITYNGATFPTTPDVQQLLVFAQSAGIAKGNTLPSEFACKDIHGVPVPMTFA